MEKELQSIIASEKVVNEALRVALAEKNATTAIEAFLDQLGKYMHCDRMYIVEGCKGEPVNNTFEWCAEGVSSEKDFLQNVPFEAVAWWYDVFESQEHLIIEDVDALKETETLTYEYLKPQNIRSLVAAPLKEGDTILGFLGVDNPSENAMRSTTYMVEIVSHFIVSLLAKKQLMDRLEKLSYEDNLTGVYNRHALNELMKNHRGFAKTGVLFCDVLGLKKINDTKGHQAGDELLIRASKALQSNFRKKDIYRVGGDEFLVVISGIEEEVFLKKIAQLREKMVENQAVMSLGAVWKPLISNMDQAMSQADHLMYEEKQAFYAMKKEDTAKSP